MPHVSVVIPVRNGARHIGEAIRSALDQGPLVAEVIVVDDRSTDGTADVVRDFRDPRVALLANAGSGPSPGRNTGARAAGGEWLLFLDADDRLRPGAVAALVQAASAAPDAGVVYGDYERIDEAGRPIGRRHLIRGRRKPSGDALPALLAGNIMVVGAQIIRRDLFVAAGGFDEGLRYCEDWHFWCLLATRSPFAYRPDLCVMEYRIHAGSTMHARVRPFSDFAPALEAIFRDEAVRARVPAGELARLKRAATASLLTYVATEAIRLRDYGSSLRSALRAIAEAPGRAPNVVLRVCGTLARL